MTELQPLIDLLDAKFGWLPTLLAYLTALRVALKFFSSGILQRLNAHMVAVAQSDDTQDDVDFERLLGSKTYRIAEFLLDVGIGFRLPTLSDFTKLLKQAVPAPK